MDMYTNFSKKKNKDQFMNKDIYEGIVNHGGMTYLNNLYMDNLGDKKTRNRLDATTSYLAERRMQESIINDKNASSSKKQKAKDRIKELDMIAQYRYGGKFDLNGVGKKKKKKDKLYDYDGPIAGEYRSQIMEGGHVNTDKLVALATAGAIGAAAIVKFAKMAAERGATKRELEAIERAKLIAGQQASGSNYSEDNMENIFVGNNGVAIVGTGAAEALADTMGQYADYAEQPGMIELGVDSLIAAQVTKHDNAESFAESDEVAIQDCLYSVGDHVVVCEGIEGDVVEVLPLPASFSDSTVTSQILLDNGVLANVTESGKCWIEMSEDGTPITTPLCKYNYLNIDGQQFSMAELGFIAEGYEELNDFSVDDYAVGIEGEEAANFGEDNELPPAANAEPAKPAENTNASENAASTTNVEPAKPAENTNASENTDANDGAPAPAPAAATEPAADPNAASATFSQENENQEANTVNFSADDYNSELDSILAFANTPDAR